MDLFHGSRFQLEPGYVLDGREAPADQGIGTEDGYVYASVRWEVAAMFAELAQGPSTPAIYLVEPLEALERDPDELDAAGSWRSARMRVIAPAMHQPA